MYCVHMFLISTENSLPIYSIALTMGDYRAKHSGGFKSRNVQLMWLCKADLIVHIVVGLLMDEV